MIPKFNYLSQFDIVSLFNQRSLIRTLHDNAIHYYGAVRAVYTQDTSALGFQLSIFSWKEKYFSLL